MPIPQSTTHHVYVCVQAIVDLWDKVLDGYADLTVVSLSTYATYTNTDPLYAHGEDTI
jgi:hypothetical protein